MFAFKMATLLHFYIVSLITVVHVSHIKMLKFFLPCMTISYKIGARFQIFFFLIHNYFSMIGLERVTVTEQRMYLVRFLSYQTLKITHKPNE